MGQMSKRNAPPPQKDFKHNNNLTIYGRTKEVNYIEIKMYILLKFEKKLSNTKGI